MSFPCSPSTRSPTASWTGCCSCSSSGTPPRAPRPKTAPAARPPRPAPRPPVKVRRPHIRRDTRARKPGTGWPSFRPDAPSSRRSTSPWTSMHGLSSRCATLPPTGPPVSTVSPPWCCRPSPSAPRRSIDAMGPATLTSPPTSTRPWSPRSWPPSPSRGFDASSYGAGAAATTCEKRSSDSTRRSAAGPPRSCPRTRITIWCRIGDPAIPGGHADSFATSIALHLRPEAVRADRIIDPQHGPVDWHASAELGAKLWEAVIDSVAATLASIAQGSAETAVVQERLHFLSAPQGSLHALTKSATLPKIRVRI